MNLLQGLNILISFILISQIETSSLRSRLCNEVYKNMIGNFVQGDQQYINALTHDQSLNAFGNYDICKENQKKNYFLVRIKVYKFLILMGMCASSECTVSDFMTLAEKDKKKIEDLVSLMYQQNFSNQTFIHIFNQNIEQGKIDQNKIWFMWGILYFSILLGLSVAGTIYSQQYQIQKQKLEWQLDQVTEEYNEIKNVLRLRIMGQAEEDISVDKILMKDQNINQHIKQVIIPKYEEKYRKNKLFQILQCFSMIDNTKELFQEMSERNQNLNIFNGIRAFFCLNTIYIHTYKILEMQVKNFNEIKKVETQPQMLIISISAQTVDTFFMMSGFLQAFIFFIKYKQVKNNISFFFSTIFHRIIRLWPNLLTCIIAYWAIYPYIGDGPNWTDEALFTIGSGPRLWKNLLFIDNYYNPETENVPYGFSWGWYLSVEFQMYIYSLILLMVYQHRKTVGLTLFILSIFGSLIINYNYGYQNNMPMIYWYLELGNTYSETVYHIPWYKLGPFLLGVLFGIFYSQSQTDKNSFAFVLSKYLEKSRFACYLCYIIGIGIMLAYSYIPYPELTDQSYYGIQAKALYFATLKTGTILGLIIFLVPGIMASEQIVIKIFANKVSNILGSLAFGIYLIHLIVVKFQVFSSRVPFNFSYLDSFYYFVQNSVVTIFFAYFLFVIVEKSFFKLEQKYLLKKENLNTKVQQQNNREEIF